MLILFLIMIMSKMIKISINHLIKKLIKYIYALIIIRFYLMIQFKVKFINKSFLFILLTFLYYFLIHYKLLIFNYKVYLNLIPYFNIL